MNPRRRRRLATQAKAMKAAVHWSVPSGDDPPRRSLFASRALLHAAWRYMNKSKTWAHADPYGNVWKLQQIDPLAHPSKIAIEPRASVAWRRRHA